MGAAESDAGLRWQVDALKRRLEGVSFVLHFASGLHAAGDVGAIHRLLLTAVTAGEPFGFRRALLFMATPGRTYLEGVCAGERPGAGPESERLTDAVRRVRVPLAGESSILVKAFHARAAIQTWSDGGDASVNSEIAPLLDCPSIVAAPVLGRGAALGVLVGGLPDGAEAVSPSLLEVMGAISQQAGIALQNARAFSKVRRRFQELQTLQEVGKGILSTIEVLQDSNLIVRIAAQMLDASGAMLRLVPEEPGETQPTPTAVPPVTAAYGSGEEIVATGGWRMEEAAALEVLRTGRPRLLYPREGEDLPQAPAPPRALMVAPLIALDRTVGCISVMDGSSQPARAHAHAFSEDDLRFLAILGNQAGIAIENARLFERVRVTERLLREAQALALRAEKLAALGEMTSRVAHEIRNPLAAIGGFARAARAALEEGHPAVQRIEVVIGESARLERFLTDHLQYLHTPDPHARPFEVNRVAEESLQLARVRGQDLGAAVECELAAGLPVVIGDPDQIKQVLLNLLDNAFDNAGAGGRVRLATGLCDGTGPGAGAPAAAGQRPCVRVCIADDGPPIPLDMQHKIFMPHFTTKAGGSGLGLAISLEIVKRHGGTIGLAREEEWNLFAVSLAAHTHDGDADEDPAGSG